MPKYHKPKWDGVPPGTYEVEIVSCKERVSHNGNEMATLELLAEPGTRPFFEHLVFVEESAWKVAQFLDALAEHLDDGEDLHVADYVGRKARVIIVVEEDEDGRKRNKVKKWLPLRPATAISSKPDDGAEEGGE